MQLTNEPHGGSFHASKDGVSYSGGLSRGVPKDSLTLVEGKTASLPVWFFDEGIQGAGRGVDFEASFKVYSCDTVEG